DEKQGSFGEWPGFSPDGKAVLERAGKGLFLKDLLTGKERVKLQPVPQPGGPGVLNPDILESPFTFSPDGRVVAVRGSRQRNEGPRYWGDNNALVFFYPQTGKEKDPGFVGTRPGRGAINPPSSPRGPAPGPPLRLRGTPPGRG